MTISTHDVFLKTTQPDLVTPLDGVWSLRVLTIGGTLINTETGDVAAGSREQKTIAGVTTFVLPAIPQSGVDPNDATYQLVFQPSGRSGSITTAAFQLDGNKTLKDLTTESGLPITPSLIEEATAARDEAVAARDQVLAAVDQQLSRTTRTKHAPALGLYFPEAEGAVGDSAGTAGSGADDSDDMQAAWDVATAAAAAGWAATVVIDSMFRIRKNLYGSTAVSYIGSGALVLDSDLSTADGSKFWINLGAISKGVSGSIGKGGRWSVNLRTTTAVTPATGMRLINAHRFEDFTFENFTIDMRATGACKVSGIGCYRDDAWCPSPSKTRLTVRGVTVLATQTGGAAGAGGEGIGMGTVAGATIEDNYVYGVGDDMVGIHASCTDVVIANNKLYGVDGRLYISTSQHFKVHHNRIERIANPDGTWNPGGALAMFEIENVNGAAPSDFEFIGNTLKHGAGITSATYGLRMRGVRRGDVLFNHIIDTSGFGYGITWEGDSDSGTWTDPEGLDIGVVQVVKFNTGTSGGTFTLNYGGGAPTSALDWTTLTTAQLTTALEGLAGIGAGNVTATGNNLAFTVVFGAAIPAPLKLGMDGALLTGSRPLPAVYAPGGYVAIAPRVRDLKVVGNWCTGGGDGRITSMGSSSSFVGPIEVHSNRPGTGGTTLSAISAYTPSAFPAGTTAPSTTYTPVSASSRPNGTDFADSGNGNRRSYKDDNGVVAPYLFNRGDVKSSSTTILGTAVDPNRILWTSALIPATILRANMVLQLDLPVSLAGVATSGTFELQHYVNGIYVAKSRLVNVDQTSAFSTASPGGRAKHVVTMYVDAIGAAGSIFAEAVGGTRSNATGTTIVETSQGDPANPGNPVTVDLTAGLTYSVKAVMSVANAGNAVTLVRALRRIIA